MKIKFTSALVLLFIATIPLILACKEKPKNTVNLQTFVEASAHRTKKITSYRYVGLATVAGKEGALAFELEVSLPDRLRLDLPGAQTSYIFKGKTLAILNHKAKTLGFQDLSDKDEGVVLETVNQVFGDYMVEGFKPSVLLIDQAVMSEKEGEWIVTLPLNDETLSALEMRFRPQSVDFLGKRFIGKEGTAQTELKILEEHPMPGSAIKVPKKWSKTQGGQTFEVTLSKIDINQTIEPARFDVTAPEGYTAKEFGK